MSIDELWYEIERLLTPRVAAALRPPIGHEALRAWTEQVGSVPSQLIELYSRHEGTDHAGGSKNFCFIGNWYPLSMDASIVQYPRMRALTDLFNVAPLIPFAIGVDGSLLGVSPDGSPSVHVVYTDGPGGEHLPNIETLMQRTIAGLRGDDPEFRPELTQDHLIWFNRKYEAGDSV